MRIEGVNHVFFDTPIALGLEPNPQKNHKNIFVSFDQAAAAHGNTRNMYRKYYVHPYLVLKYADGSIKKIHFFNRKRNK